jgi:hypothetical protein
MELGTRWLNLRKRGDVAGSRGKGALPLRDPTIPFS